MYNRVEYMVALFATLKIGATIVPINFRYGDHEVARAARSTRESEALIFPTSLEADGRRRRRADRPSLTLVRVDDEPASRRRARRDRVRRRPNARHAGPTVRATAPRDGELYLFTGGTTGHPKAVVWPIDALLTIQLYPIYTTVGLDVPGLGRRDGRRRPRPRRRRARRAPARAVHARHGAVQLDEHVRPRRHARDPPERPVRRPPRRSRDHVDRAVTRLVVAGDSVAIPLLDAADELGVTESSVAADGDQLRACGSATPSRRACTRSARCRSPTLVAATEGGPFADRHVDQRRRPPARLALLPDAVVLDESFNEIQDEPGPVGLLAYRGTLPTGIPRRRREERRPPIP